MKKHIYILFIITIIFSLTACQNENVTKDNGGKKELQQENVKYPVTITDDSETEVTIDKMPEKIASGAPANTEIIYALKRDNLLVGVTSYCNYPEEAKNKTVTGDYNGPNIEKLVELGSELYITDWIDEGVRKQLDEAGVKTIVLSAADYNSVYDKIETIGKILDAEYEADNLITSMKEKTNKIIEKVKGSDNKKVFFEIWHDPLQTACKDSFISEMITMAGGVNIAGDIEGSYAEYSSELLIENNPEVYLTSDDGFKTKEDLKARPGYDQIDAIKNDNIYFLDADISSRPGPRIVEALELIAKCIHPEVFE